MEEWSRRLVAQSLRVVLGLSILFVASPSWSADPLAGIAPLDPNALAGAVTNQNIVGNLTSIQANSQSNKVNDTNINVGKNGQLINGNVDNNSVTNNSGLTSVMVNTGNNVNFSNSFIVNIIMGK